MGLLRLKNTFQDYKNINSKFLLEHNMRLVPTYNMFLLECVINTHVQMKRTGIYKVYV